MKYYHFIWGSLGLCVLQLVVQGPLSNSKWLSYLFFGAQSLLLGGYLVLLAGYFVVQHTVKAKPVESSAPETKAAPTVRQAATYVDLEAKAS